jgi:hypothetical protein
VEEGGAGGGVEAAVNGCPSCVAWVSQKHSGQRNPSKKLRCH